MINLIFFLLLISKDTLANDLEVSEKIKTTSIGYVISGNKSIDEVSKNGLSFISKYISSKTSTIIDSPIGINIKEDDIDYYPLIYWPIDSSQQPLLNFNEKKIQEYINRGGVIIFDCKIGSKLIFIEDCFKKITFGNKLDISDFKYLDKNHTMSKSFYLIDEFPGRRNNEVFFAFNNQNQNDQVSSIIIGTNDWSGAWARDDDDQFLFPLLTGNENQRLISLRFGINLIVYSLTGNYKSDQVHVPEILKRMKK